MCIFHIALAVELKGQGHIMFQIIDYVGYILKLEKGFQKNQKLRLQIAQY